MMVGWEKMKPQQQQKKVFWLSLTASLTGFGSENGQIFIISTDSTCFKGIPPLLAPSRRFSLSYPLLSLNFKYFSFNWLLTHLTKSNCRPCHSWGVSSLGLFLPGAVLQGELYLSRISFSSPGVPPHPIPLPLLMQRPQTFPAATLDLWVALVLSD